MAATKAELIDYQEFALDTCNLWFLQMRPECVDLVSSQQAQLTLALCFKLQVVETVNLRRLASDEVE